MRIGSRKNHLRRGKEKASGFRPPLFRPQERKGGGKGSSIESERGRGKREWGPTTVWKKGTGKRGDRKKGAGLFRNIFLREGRELLPTGVGGGESMRREENFGPFVGVLKGGEEALFPDRETRSSGGGREKKRKKTVFEHCKRLAKKQKEDCKSVLGSP